MTDYTLLCTTQGMFRHRGVIMLCSSFTQAITINHDYSMQATGKQNKMAQFRVHKISTGGVRMFESMMSPSKFIRMKDGKIDCLVSYLLLATTQGAMCSWLHETLKVIQNSVR